MQTCTKCVYVYANTHTRMHASSTKVPEYALVQCSIVIINNWPSNSSLQVSPPGTLLLQHRWNQTTGRLRLGRRHFQKPPHCTSTWCLSIASLHGTAGMWHKQFLLCRGYQASSTERLGCWQQSVCRYNTWLCHWGCQHELSPVSHIHHVDLSARVSISSSTVASFCAALLLF